MTGFEPWSSDICQLHHNHYPYIHNILFWLFAVSSIPFKKSANPGLFNRLFAVFSSKQTSLQFLQQINVKTCPSSIWCRDSKPRPLEHESPPITNRPGLLLIALYPLLRTLVNLKCTLIFDRGQESMSQTNEAMLPRYTTIKNFDCTYVQSQITIFNQSEYIILA